MEDKNASELERNSASGAIDLRDGSPLEDLEEAQKFTGAPKGADGGPDNSSKDLPQDHRLSLPD